MDNTELLPCPFCGGVALCDSVVCGELTLWSVECPDNDCGAKLFGFTSKEAAIAKWNKHQPVKTYAHRNGETAPPVEPGRYWFLGSYSQSWSQTGLKRKIVCNDIVFVDKQGRINAAEEWISSDWQGQWWGPITSPWEEINQS